MALGSRLRSAVGTAWRSIQSAVASGMSAFDIGNTFRRAGQPIDTTIVDQLAGMAQGLEQATAAIRDAEDNALVDSTMVSLAPWSADLNTFNTSPRYWAHVELQMELPDGSTYSAWRYITGITDVTGTVADLRNMLYVNALGLTTGTVPGGGLEGTLASIGDITLSVAPAVP